jgi:hypothetical protein
MEGEDGVVTMTILGSTGLLKKVRLHSDANTRRRASMGNWSVEEDGDYIIRARSFASGQEGAYALTVAPRE